MVLAGILFFAIVVVFDDDKCDNGNGNDRERCPTNAKLSDKPDCVWCDRHIDWYVAGFPKVEQLAGRGRSVFVKRRCLVSWRIRAHGRVVCPQVTTKARRRATVITLQRKMNFELLLSKRQCTSVHGM